MTRPQSPRAAFRAELRRVLPGFRWVVRRQTEDHFLTARGRRGHDKADAEKLRFHGGWTYAVKVNGLGWSTGAIGDPLDVVVHECKRVLALLHKQEQEQADCLLWALDALVTGQVKS